ncbi:MAG: hypothetical protein WCH60_19985 [Burkholderiales bacterium]
MTGFRQHIDQRNSPKGKTLNLFADDPVIGRYRFSALISDMDSPAETVWPTYRGRANYENRIKELTKPFQHTLQTLRYKLFTKPVTPL